MLVGDGWVVEKLEYDVVVVGSGAGGMLAAIRAHDLGLRSVVIEKSDRFGGTSAVSGGAIWIPNNDDFHGEDSPEKALEYLIACTENTVPQEKLSRYVEVSPELPRYLKKLGVEYYAHPVMSYPDYYPWNSGSQPRGRTMFVKPVDGTGLGEEFYRIRESYPEFKLFGKITMDLDEGAQIAGKYPGWIKTLAGILWRYYTDFGWRKKTHRDRKLGLGNALTGGLRKAMIDRGIPLRLKTRLTSIVREADGRVTGIVAEHNGAEIHITAQKGVIMASGGFEQSKELRDTYFEQKTDPRWSATPRDNNTGDALLAAIDIGADTAFMKEAWWAPTISMPSKEAPNTVRNIALFFERGYPHIVAVNRLGKRFTNEIVSYHQFGQAMMRDNAATGANLPCWLIFDAEFRANYPLGGLLPGSVQPDSRLPADWFDNFLYKADTIEELAGKMEVPRDTLVSTISRFNGFAEKGIDEDFGKGDTVYNKFFGDPRHPSPNKVLGAVAKAPFYAVRCDMGDIGSKGGPKTDENANVLDKSGKPIPGLYAVGNAAGSVMGAAYPGAGATLGAAMTFAYVASTKIAQVNSWK
jgi:3-oxosteroid 1-dehydrogenase